jgi:hypothetical protein
MDKTIFISHLLENALKTGIVVHIIIFIVLSFRFRNWSKSQEEDLIFGFPFIVLLLGTIGSLFTVGIFGIISVFGIPALLFYGWIGQLKFQNPQNTIKWHISGLVLWLTFFLIRFYALYDFKTNQFFCTFHDDYSYILQTNLLESTQRESGCWELLRKLFGLDYNYQFYHFIEFYFILFFKKILGGNTFNWFNIIFKSSLQSLAVLTATSFVLLRSNTKTKFYLVLFSVLLFFTTLRFNLIDDTIAKYFPHPYFKSVFFQNYYFSSPLSYFGSYKISLGFIFIIPILNLFYITKIRNADIIALSIPSVLATVVSIPILVTLSISRIASKFISNRQIALYATLSIFIIALFIYFITGSYRTVRINQFLFTLFFFNFNFLFENFYWLMFYFGTIVLTFTRMRNINKIVLTIILLFPLIYILPGLGFKIYSGLFLLLLFYLIWTNHWFFRNNITNIFIPSLFLIHFLGIFFNHFFAIADIGQAYTNYMQLIICLGLSVFLFQYEIRRRSLLLTLIFLFLGLVNVPAIIYDNKTPLHREIIPSKFFDETILKKDIVRCISISENHNNPYLHRYLLGNGILNKCDNVFISNGGFGNPDNQTINNFKSMGYYNIISRLPEYEFLNNSTKEFKDFIIEKNINIVLIENSIFGQKYKDSILPITRKIYHETERDYDIHLIDPLLQYR